MERVEGSVETEVQVIRWGWVVSWVKPEGGEVMVRARVKGVLRARRERERRGVVMCILGEIGGS